MRHGVGLLILAVPMVEEEHIMPHPCRGNRHPVDLLSCVIRHLSVAYNQSDFPVYASGLTIPFCLQTRLLGHPGHQFAYSLRA
jgi:hypothetical protein